MKHLLLWIMLFAFSVGASAQDQKKDAMVIETTAGEKVSFVFDEKPEMSFQGEFVIISTTSGNVEYSMADVARVFFEEGNTSSIKNAAAGDVRFYLSGDQLRAEGLSPSSPMSVYSIGGSLLLTTKAGADGTAQLSMASLSKGVYIVKTNKISYKITK